MCDYKVAMSTMAMIVGNTKDTNNGVVEDSPSHLFLHSKLLSMASEFAPPKPKALALAHRVCIDEPTLVGNIVFSCGFSKVMN